MTRKDAIKILAALDIALDEDFHTLSSSKVDALLAEADRIRYRKPKNANGSRGRYFCAFLQRKAKDRPFQGFIQFRR